MAILLKAEPHFQTVLWKPRCRGTCCSLTSSLEPVIELPVNPLRCCESQHSWLTTACSLISFASGDAFAYIHWGFSRVLHSWLAPGTCLGSAARPSTFLSRVWFLSIPTQYKGEYVPSNSLDCLGESFSID